MCLQVDCAKGLSVFVIFGLQGFLGFRHVATGGFTASLCEGVGFRGLQGPGLLFSAFRGFRV